MTEGRVVNFTPKSCDSFMNESFGSLARPIQSKSVKESQLIKTECVSVWYGLTEMELLLLVKSVVLATTNGLEIKLLYRNSYKCESHTLF